MAKTKKNFINESFQLYQRTGNLRPLVQELKCYSISLIRKYGKLKEFNDGDLWGSILERIAIGLKAYDPNQGSPFKFFSGLLHRHIFYKSIEISRGRCKQSVEFNEEIYIDQPDEPIHDELDRFVSSMADAVTNPKIRAFTDELKLCIREGKNVLFVRDSFEDRLDDRELEAVDLIIVQCRRKYCHETG